MTDFDTPENRAALDKITSIIRKALGEGERG